ncbi:unnamed protein product [Clonostachys rosea]|uniref:NmrA-like domain-containing protein n=1 Tax=Bionectria ochroleuca TaxID=29856 RepID=A0ABY6V0T1_BIOOC|nr:unnamed protein product [Clonostachys rosea]
MAFKNVALLGANGQIGNEILHALVSCPEYKFNVLAFIRPGASLNYNGDRQHISIKHLDFFEAEIDEVASLLQGIDVLVSALGGSTLPKQRLFQDAAAKAGVKRFFPSEFGMPSIVRLVDSDVGFLHPTWDLKMKCLEEAIKHPSIRDGRMSYTVIGCADNFDASREHLCNPWLRKNASDYTIHCVGNPDAKMDYTCIRDISRYLVAAICRPDLSENRQLGFSGEYISFREVGRLLETISGKPVTICTMSWDEAAQIIRDPSKAPKDMAGDSTFPVDFLVALRHVQGEGMMWRPPGQVNNDQFPEVQQTTLAAYFTELFH